MSDSERFQHASVLMDKVLKRSENQADTGYYWEKTRSLYLYGNLNFRYVIHTMSSVSGGGLSMPSENEEVAEGRWSIRMVGFTPHLVLLQDGNEVLSWRSENGGQGLHYLDGEAWDRYRIE